MDTGDMVILGAVFGVVLGFFVALGVWLQRRSSASSAGRWRAGVRKEKPGAPAPKGKGKKARKRRPHAGEPLMVRITRPLAQFWKLGDSSQSRLQELLVHAGFRQKGAVEIFLGAKFALALALPAGAVAAFLWRAHSTGMPVNMRMLFTASVVGLILGMMIPIMWLRSRARKRIERIRISLPDALDLLIVCVESGLGLDAALLRISKETEEVASELSEELALMNLEIAAGKPRNECLRNLALRSGCEEMESLAARINQAAKFGTNLGNSLRIHSDSLRQKRRQQAEERAAKTSVKLLFPLVFCIFPAIFVVILGPAMVSLREHFAS